MYICYTAQMVKVYASLGRILLFAIGLVVVSIVVVHSIVLSHTAVSKRPVTRQLSSTFQSTSQISLQVTPASLPTATPILTIVPTAIPTPTPFPTVVQIDPSNDSAWEELAQCESGGNWADDTGNGYYGGLQFSQSAWEGVGGVGKPSDASRDEQILRGKLLQERRGWAPWGACSRELGL